MRPLGADGDGGGGGLRATGSPHDRSGQGFPGLLPFFPGGGGQMRPPGCDGDGSGGVLPATGGDEHGRAGPGDHDLLRFFPGGGGPIGEPTRGDGDGDYGDYGGLPLTRTSTIESYDPISFTQQTDLMIWDGMRLNFQPYEHRTNGGTLALFFTFNRNFLQLTKVVIFGWFLAELFASTICPTRLITIGNQQETSTTFCAQVSQLIANCTTGFVSNFQGSRLTAFELVHEKIPATLIADSAAAALMNNGQVQAVIVGADRIAANGDTANKIGTYNLSISAKHHGMQFYVAAPVTSIDLSLPSGKEIVIEERSPKELLNSEGGLGKQVAASGISVWNPAFDVTPATLITAIITEKGVITKSDPDGTFDIKGFIKSAN